MLPGITAGGFPPIQLIDDLPDWTLNNAYSATATRRSGFAPFVWTIESGSLPTGLTLNEETGEISGTPTVADSFQFTLRVTDTTGAYSEQDCTISIADDPHWNLVELLLGFDGSDDEQAAPDESSRGRTVTFHGTAALDVGVRKFGTASLRTDGSSGSYVSIAHADALSVVSGSGDWTIEFWFRPNELGKQQGLSNKRDTTGSEEHGIYFDSTNTLRVQLFNAGDAGVVSDATALNTGQFYHVAATRSGNTLRLFRDGELVGSVTVGTVAGNTEALQLGRDGAFPGLREFNGWMDEYRFTKGVARYTSSFTLPEAPFPRG